MSRDPSEVARLVAERGRRRRAVLAPVALAIRAERDGRHGALAELRAEAGRRAEVADLAGRGIPGFFPTPRALARLMVERADVRDGQAILEPSAGAGHLLEAIRAAAPGARLTACEFNATLRAHLLERGETLAGADFLEFSGGPFDRVVMNPPFERGQDAEHVRHAFELLAPGGRLVAIMSVGPFFRSDRRSVEFRSWLEALDAAHEPLAPGVFQASERPTGVRTELVVIDR